ncbi:MAG: hypothetical protein CMB64_02620 [Euryarchaeota archaeon]|nr:hypothetical protein [Euryarchaeota archaeon]|tara:strand:+ start:1162 stop:1719 length:558 start_codon:yes stop_codon:yes gene_type:complete
MWKDLDGLMNWPIDEFNATRKKVTILCFISLLIPSFMLYHIIINVRGANSSNLILAMCLIHIYVSLMYAFPKLFTRYTNIFILILGEDTISGKGFENNKQRLFFVFSQAIAAASIVEISRWIIEFIIKNASFIKDLDLEAGIIYSLICTTLVTSFLFIGITRLREKHILQEHWGAKRLLQLDDSI